MSKYVFWRTFHSKNIHKLVSRGCYWKMMKQWVMFIVGPVHAQDHDPECFVAGVRNQQQGLQEVGFILCPFRNINEGREPSLPSVTWRPSSRSERFKLYNISNITVKIFTIWSPSVCSLPYVGWTFCSLLLCNYHITEIAGVGQVQELQEYIHTRNTGYCI